MVGLRLLGFDLITVVDLQHEHLDAESIAAGGRISTAAPPVPLTILGARGGAALMHVGPTDGHAPASAPADEGPAHGAGAATPDAEGPMRDDGRGRR